MDVWEKMSQRIDEESSALVDIVGAKADMLRGAIEDAKRDEVLASMKRIDNRLTAIETRLAAIEGPEDVN